MVGAVTARFEGGRQLEARMRELPNRTRGAVLTRTLRIGAEPIRAAAQAGAPRESGDLQGSLIIATRVTGNQRRQRPSWPPSTKEISIGPSSDGSTGVLNYAHLTEFGSAHSRGTAWFTRAYEAKKGEAMELIRLELARQIERSLSRMRNSR